MDLQLMAALSNADAIAANESEVRAVCAITLPHMD